MSSENDLPEEPCCQTPPLVPQKLSVLFGISRGALFLRGVIFLLLGVMFWLRPVQTMLAITLIVGAYILIEGIMLFVTALKLKASTRGLFVLNAILLVLLGIFSLLSPLWMDTVWIIIIGVWELLGGFQSLFYPVKSGSGRFWTVVSGLLSIVIGLVFIMSPVIGIFAVAWLVALLLIVSGISVVATALTIR